MNIINYFGKWCDQYPIASRLFNCYVLMRLRSYAKKDPRILANRIYRSVFNKDIDWGNPQSLIEKIYWLQIYTDTSLWSICADKYRIREYVKEKNLEWLMPKLYGHWDNSKNIDFKSLPKAFVLKTTNGCGQVLLVRDKAMLDIKNTRELLDRWMRMRYGFDDAQIHYTRIKPCIIAEEFLINSKDETKGMTDYKLWCLNGRVEYILCAYDRIVLGKDRGYHLSAYDRNWNNISKEAIKESKRGNQTVERPKHLDEMIKYAELFAKDFCEVRVDFYETAERIYLGELTFTSGYGSHYDAYYDKLGSKLDITNARRIEGINRPDITKL